MPTGVKNDDGISSHIDACPSRIGASVPALPGIARLILERKGSVLVPPTARRCEFGARRSCSYVRGTQSVPVDGLGSRQWSWSLPRFWACDSRDHIVIHCIDGL